MSKFGFVIAGVVGLIGGAVGGYFLAKKRCESMADEEIAHVKEEYRKKRGATKKKVSHESSEKIEKVESCEKAKAESFEKDDAKIETPAEKAYIIHPDDFGDEDEYSQILMTYYEGDSVLANESEEPIEDVEELFGFDPIPHMGELEPDSVCLRDDHLKCYYEILRDEGKYTDDPRHRVMRKE